MFACIDPELVTYFYFSSGMLKEAEDELAKTTRSLKSKFTHNQTEGNRREMDQSYSVQHRIRLVKLMLQTIKAFRHEGKFIWGDILCSQTASSLNRFTPSI